MVICSFVMVDVVGGELVAGLVLSGFFCCVGWWYWDEGVSSFGWFVQRGVLCHFVLVGVQGGGKGRGF